MRKYLITLLCALMAAAAGCSYTPPEKKLKNINIAFQEWVGYGPFFLARDKGFFEDEGIRINFIDEQLDSGRRDAFKAGMLDCEGGTIDLLISKKAQGTPITAVLELDRSFGGDGIVAAEDITSLKDLIGKRVVFARDDVSDTLISYLFREAGLPMDGLKIVYRGPEAVAQVFLDGEADAVVTWEPWLSKALQREGAHILISTKDTPEIIIDTLNVRDDLIKDDPALVKGLMRSWFKALKYYNEHPAESNKLIAARYGMTPEQYGKAVEKLRWTGYKDQVTPEKNKELTGVFNTISDIKFKAGRINTKPDARQTLNDLLLRELYHENNR